MKRDNFRSLLPMALVFYGFGLIFAAQDNGWGIAASFAVGTVVAGYGIVADYKGWK